MEGILVKKICGIMSLNILNKRLQQAFEQKTKIKLQCDVFYDYRKINLF